MKVNTAGGLWDTIINLRKFQMLLFYHWGKHLERDKICKHWCNVLGPLMCVMITGLTSSNNSLFTDYGYIVKTI